MHYSNFVVWIWFHPISTYEWPIIAKMEPLLWSTRHPSSNAPMIRYMMTSSNGNIFRVTGHLCGEFTGPGEFPAQWPVTRSFVFFDLRPNERLSKQWWGWWFETPSRSLWRQCSVIKTTSIQHPNYPQMCRYIAFVFPFYVVVVIKFRFMVDCI